jgi:hypothetical protein
MQFIDRAEPDIIGLPSSSVEGPLWGDIECIVLRLPVDLLAMI